MSEVQSWSSTAASNNSASPDGWPEAMAPSGINNSARENMAAIAKWYKDGNGSLASTGSSNAYVLSPNRTIAAYAAGINFTFLANHANTGAATINVSTLGAKDIRDRNGNALTGSEIAVNGVVEIVYDATNGYFRATNIVANSASSTPSASETVQGIVELATAAETLTGSSTSLALTPGGFAGNKSLTSAGYYKLPGGMLIQWGASTVGATTTDAITFSVAFPGSAAAVSITILEGNTTAREALKCTRTNSTLTVYNPNAATMSYLWIAVGY